MISRCISMRVGSSRAENGSSIRMMRRLEHERAGDRDALLLAAGELVRVLALVALEAHPA